MIEITNETREAMRIWQDRCARPPWSLRMWAACKIAISAVVLTGVCPALAQPEVIRCLQPETPMTALSEAVLTEYRAEIAAEFEAYYGAVSDYIACLDDERARALTEAHAATEAYSNLLSTLPTKKDLP